MGVALGTLQPPQHLPGRASRWPAPSTTVYLLMYPCGHTNFLYVLRGIPSDNCTEQYWPLNLEVLKWSWATTSILPCHLSSSHIPIFYFNLVFCLSQMILQLYKPNSKPFRSFFKPRILAAKSALSTHKIANLRD